jgi:heme/copper-type cytochrome/quinol oxidase subunit 2
VQRTLVILGLLLVLVGLAWPWLGKLPFGRLPGDIVVNRENFRVYFPLTTMIIVSILLSVIVWFLRK